MMVGIDAKKNLDFVLGLVQMSLFSTEATLQFNPDGIKVNIHDSANICFGCLKYNKFSFVNYDVSSPEKIRINLKELKTIINKIKTGTFFFIYENGKFYVSVVGKTTKKFELAIYDDSENSVEYDREYEYKGVVDTEDILEAVEDTSYIQTGIIFLMEDKLSINTGDEMKKATILVNMEGNIPQGSKSTYSQDYVQKIFSKKVTEKSVVGFKKDFPLLVIFQNENIELKYYLAPRISDD